MDWVFLSVFASANFLLFERKALDLKVSFCGYCLHYYERMISFSLLEKECHFDGLAV
jgi:hypothetical protein